MTKTEVAKAIAAFVIGSATYAVVKEIIKNNTSPEKVTDKAAIIIASYVLGCIAADASVKWTEKKIDELIASFQKARHKDALPTV